MFGCDIESKFIEKNPADGSFVWKVKLSREGQVFVFKFTKGSAHVGFLNRKTDKWRMATVQEIHHAMCEYYSWRKPSPIPPDIREVLECLQSDVQPFQSNISYKDFAGEFGYDKDSIKGKKIFRKCRKYERKMRVLLGSAWQEYLDYRFDG